MGEAEDKYLLHRSILVHESGYFRAALSGDWQEAVTKTVRLADVGSMEFTLFATWLMGGDPKELGVERGAGRERTCG